MPDKLGILRKMDSIIRRGGAANELIELEGAHDLSFLTSPHTQRLFTIRSAGFIDLLRRKVGPYHPSRHLLSILDVGCDVGIEASAITSYFGRFQPVKYVGVDINESAVLEARLRHLGLITTEGQPCVIPDPQHSFLCVDMRTPLGELGLFDIVVFSHPAILRPNER